MPNNTSGKKRDRTREYARHKLRMEEDPEYREEHLRRSREHSRKWREKNRAKVNAAAADYRRRNPEKVKELQRRRWQENKGEEQKRYRAWYEANIERERERALQYKRANPEKNREAERRRRLRKKGISLNAEDRAVSAAWAEILWRDPCSYTREPVPCEHIDHIVPLVGGGDHSWDNLTSASASKNSTKNSASLLHFMLDQLKVPHQI